MYKYQKNYSLATITILLLVPCMLHSMESNLEKLEQGLQNRKEVDQRVRSYLLTTLAKIRTLEEKATYSRDGKYIAHYSHGGIAIRDAKTFDYLCTIRDTTGVDDRSWVQPENSIAYFSFSPVDSNIIFVGTFGSHGLVNFATKTHQFYKEDARGARWKPDGSSLFHVDKRYGPQGKNQDNRIYVREIPVPDSIRNLNVQSNEQQGLGTTNKTLAYKQTFSDKSDKCVMTLIDLSAGTTIGQIDHDKRIERVIFSDDGTKILTVPYPSHNNTVWDTTTCTRLFEIISETELINAIFSPDSTTLITATQNSLRSCYGSTITFWDVTTSQNLFSFTDREINYLNLAWNGPLMQLFTGGKGDGKPAGEGHIWDLQKMTDLNRTLSELSDEHTGLLQGIGQAMHDKNPIHATAKEWATFQSLPEQFQKPLEKFMQRPVDTNNN